MSMNTKEEDLDFENEWKTPVNVCIIYYYILNFEWNKKCFDYIMMYVYFFLSLMVFKSYLLSFD